MSSRRRVIDLYRQMLTESKKIPSYNFRMYAVRKIRDAFQINKTLNSFEEIEQQIQIGRQNLQLIRRQAIIGHLYTAEKLVIEQKPNSNDSTQCERLPKEL